MTAAGATGRAARGPEDFQGDRILPELRPRLSTTAPNHTNFNPITSSSFAIASWCL